MFIYECIDNYEHPVVISTNNMDITYKNVVFTRHITDFSYVPEYGKNYNLVLTNSQSEEIYEYLKKYNHIIFRVDYDRTNTMGLYDKKLALAILDLPNIKMQAWGTIKQCIKNDKMHKMICRLLYKLCNNEVIPAYIEVNNETNASKR
jgi:hypothetical protein